MFKSQRRISKNPPKNASVKKIVDSVVEVEEVYSPKAKRLRSSVFGDRNRTNRCTIIKPSYKDFGQLAEIRQSLDKHKNVFREQFKFAPVIPETIEKLQELKNALCQSETKIEDTSQYGTPKDKSNANLIQDCQNETQWQNVETTDDLYKFIPSSEGKIVRSKVKFIPSEVKIVPCRDVNNADVQNVEKKPPTPFPTRIRISEVPRIKVMAEKFSMFKRNNIELRRLEEKVVCLEYDIFDQDAETGKPFQRMRAFFSIKPKKKGKDAEHEDISMIPSAMKRNFNVNDGDLDSKLNNKEIEIIDENFPENRSLLEDLKKVLRRNQVWRHKKEQGSLDLMYLYEMAKKNLPLDEEYLNNNVLTNEELEEIKELILKKSVSSIHGISRRKVKSRTGRQGDAKNSDACVVSDSLIMELMRDVQMDATNTA